MRILALDQATRKSGWAFGVDEHIEQYGVIKSTPAELSAVVGPTTPERWMRHQIRALIVQYAPQIVAFEAVHLGENVRTLITLAEFRGMCIALAEDMGREVMTVTSAEVNHYLHLPVRTKRAQKKARSQFVSTADVFGSVQASDGGSLLLQEDISDSICILRIAETKVRMRALASASRPADALSAAQRGNLPVAR